MKSEFQERMTNRLTQQKELLGDCINIYQDLHFYYFCPEDKVREVLDGDWFFSRTVGYMRYILIIQLNMLITSGKSEFYNINKTLADIENHLSKESWVNPPDIEKLRLWKEKLNNTDYSQLRADLKQFRDKIAAHLDKEHDRISLTPLFPRMEDLIDLISEILNEIHFWMYGVEVSFETMSNGKMESTVGKLLELEELRIKYYG